MDEVSVSPPGFPAGCHVMSQKSGQANLKRSNLLGQNSLFYDHVTCQDVIFGNYSAHMTQAQQAQLPCEQVYSSFLGARREKFKREKLFSTPYVRFNLLNKTSAIQDITVIEVGGRAFRSFILGARHFG